MAQTKTKKQTETKPKIAVNLLLILEIRKWCSSNMHAIKPLE